jgi:uncharacterized membrane protein
LIQHLEPIGLDPAGTSAAGSSDGMSRADRGGPGRPEHRIEPIDHGRALGMLLLSRRPDVLTGQDRRQELAPSDGIGNTPAMTASPPPTLYHRWMGWHAPALRRVAILAGIGLAVTLALLPILPWQPAVVTGWDAAALTYLGSIWPIILRADSAQAEQLATREDETRGSATVLLLAASVASLLGVGGALSLAGRQSGPPRVLLIGLAVVTVFLSWTVVNTVYTLHYAHRDFGSTAPGIAFGDAAGQERPTYRDFAYVAFTIGMTYQVSDTTVGDPRIRRAVLSHALLSYVFGVVIIGGSVNLIAGLLR